jgi:hypothetical protein
MFGETHTGEPDPRETQAWVSSLQTTRFKTCLKTTMTRLKSVSNASKLVFNALKLVFGF